MVDVILVFNKHNMIRNNSYSQLQQLFIHLNTSHGQVRHCKACGDMRYFYNHVQLLPLVPCKRGGPGTSCTSEYHVNAIECSKIDAEIRILKKNKINNYFDDSNGVWVT